MNHINVMTRVFLTLCCLLFCCFSAVDASAFTVTSRRSDESINIILTPDEAIQDTLTYDPNTKIVYMKSSDGTYFPYYSAKGKLYRYSNGVLEEVATTDLLYIINLFCIVSLLVFMPLSFKRMFVNMLSDINYTLFRNAGKEDREESVKANINRNTGVYEEKNITSVKLPPFKRD